LPAAKQTFRAVDGIQGPETLTRAPATSIDPIQYLIGVQMPVGLPYNVNDAT
jgi:hypothetical protein